MQIRRIGLEVASRGHEVWVSCVSLIFLVASCLANLGHRSRAQYCYRALTESELPLASCSWLQFLAEESDIAGKSHLDLHNATLRTYKSSPVPDLESGDLELRVGSAMTQVSCPGDVLQLSSTGRQNF